MQLPKDLVSPIKLAEEVGVRPQQIYGWIRGSGLPSHLDEEGRIRVSRSQAIEWIKNRRRTNARAGVARQVATLNMAASVLVNLGETELANKLAEIAENLTK